MNAGRVVSRLFAMAKRHGQLVDCMHEARLGVATDGTPQYGTPTGFEAMWLAERERIQDVNGENVMSSGQLWVPSTYSMNEQDRIILPDGTQNTILQIQATASGTAFTHYQVFF